MELEFNLGGSPEFTVDGEIPEFSLGGFLVSAPPSYSFSVKELAKSEISLALDLPNIEVDQNVESGFLPDYENRIRQNNLLNFREGLKFDLTKYIRENDGAEIELDSKLATEVNELEVGLHPTAAAAIYNSDEENIFRNVNRLGHYRLEQFRRMVQEKFESSDDGFWNGLGYMLDALVSYPKDVVAGGGFRRGDLATETFKLANDPNITGEEATRRFKEILEEVADSGMFSDNNWFYTGQFIEDFVNGASTYDKLFTIIDATTLGAGRLAKVPFKLRKSTDISAATGRAEKVVEQIETKVLTKPNDPELPPTLSPAAERPMDVAFTNGFFSAPGREWLVSKELAWRVLELVTRRDFGYFIRPEVWEREAPRILEETKERAERLGSKRLIDYNIDDGLGFNGGKARLGNPLAVAVYGTTKGKYYTPQYRYKAQAFADEIGGEVIEVMDEGKVKLAVRKEWNVETKSLYDPIKDSEITTNLFQLLGSTYLTTSMRLDRILKRGESQLGGTFQEIFKDYNRIRKSVKKETRTFVDDVFTELRDGVEAERKVPLSMPEFRQRFYQRFGRKATEADEEYFRTISDINNAAYLLLADQHFKNAVNHGGQVLLNGDSKFVVFPAREDRILKQGGRESMDKPVWNLDTGKPMDLPDDLTGVLEVHEGFEAGSRGVYQFVYTEKGRFRRLFHDDVLGYNVGGPRVYDEFKFFVGQTNDVALAGQKAPARVDRVFMGVRTEKEALKARDEINELFTAIRERITPTGSRFNDLQRVRSLANDVDFNTLVARTTTWNDDINSVDDLVDFLEKQKLDFSKDVEFKGNNEKLTNDINFFTANSEAQTGIEFMRQVSFRTRGDTPLVGYGGKKASVLPPHVAIERNFTRQLTATANAPYMKNAVEGWLSGAAEAGVVRKIDTNLPPLEQLLKAEVNTSTKVGRAFEQERNVIRRRIANEDWLTKHWKATVSMLADWVYDKGAQRMGVSFENMFSENPLHWARSVAFHLKLGLFAFDQLLVQSNQAVNVVAIGGANGFRGAVLSLPLQMALHNGTRPVAEYIGSRAATMIGLKPEEFVELVEFMKHSGRFAVGREVAEQDMNFRLAQGATGKVLEAGRVFFNEGERFARVSAAAVAYLDLKKAFPKIKLTDPKATDEMTGRMDILTAGMTSGSATAWQRNSMTAVPFQFMSYTSRMTEQLLSTRILTQAERTRLAAAQTFFWGLTGVGLGWAVDKLLAEDVISTDRDLYTALRYGALDFIIGKTTDSRTAFADRLSFPGAIYELLENTTSENFWTNIGGPSLNIGSALFADTVQTIGDAIHGRRELVETDLKAMASNLAVVSKATRAYHLWTTGRYLNRHGNEVADGFSRAEAFFATMGAPLQDVNFAYEQNIRQRDRRKALDEIGYLIQNRMTMAIRHIAEGDEVGGKAMIREVASMVTVYDGMDRDYLTRFLKPNTLNLLETVIKREIQTMENDNILRARALGE